MINRVAVKIISFFSAMDRFRNTYVLQRKSRKEIRRKPNSSLPESGASTRILSTTKKLHFRASPIKNHGQTRGLYG